MTVLRRRDAVAQLLKERKDALVVTGLGAPGYDVMAAGDHDNNFYLWGAMGGAAMVGLGLALSQTRRTVLVVTGDGEHSKVIPAGIDRCLEHLLRVLVGAQT